MSIAENWHKIQTVIAACASQPVQVVAVTKTRSPDDIRKVIAAGAAVLGENRVEEARTKFLDRGLLKEFPHVSLHMIGHLQTRKVRDAVELFNCIQSLDSVKLAREINARCDPISKIMEVMIEVNVSGEKQKYGISPADTPNLVREVLSLPHLRLTGLMTMAPYTDDQTMLRKTFGGLLNLKNSLSAGLGADHFTILSMGMSNDYRIAIEEGSTMLRIGSAIFEEL